jgi:hypothetical protein
MSARLPFLTAAALFFSDRIGDGRMCLGRSMPPRRGDLVAGNDVKHWCNTSACNPFYTELASPKEASVEGLSFARFARAIFWASPARVQGRLKRNCCARLSMPAATVTPAKSNANIDGRRGVIPIRGRRSVSVGCRCDDTAAKAGRECDKGDNSKHDSPPVKCWRSSWRERSGSRVTARYGPLPCYSCSGPFALRYVCFATRALFTVAYVSQMSD